MAGLQLPPVQPPKRFPFCIVWSPIPFIGWVLPFIGHVGICTSEGVILDFAGPFFISIDSMAFGNPARYLQLQPSKAAVVAQAALQRSTEAGSTAEQGVAPSADVSADPMLAAVSREWDQLLQQSAGAYQHHNYNFLGDNCHCFVSHFLNAAEYRASRWNMVRLASEMFLRARYVAFGGVLKTWLPFCIVMTIGLYFGRLIFLYCWLGLLGLLGGYFCLYALCSNGRASEDAAIC
ncbi:hypothetical protein WJX72_012194 [[Myrmecia] bisecta]|uniref:Uncharacterized protein n=1 Tax=[Myrmecia] bisecta TaxID=41462 RepID=A0AAW1P9L3_9CHLO